MLNIPQYSDSIKFLHLPEGGSIGIPIYSQAEPMRFVSLTLNSINLPATDIFIIYSAPSADVVNVFAIINTALLSTPFNFIYDIEFKNGFTLSRFGAGGDATIAYQGPTIII
jgi:predicted transposase YdaD